MNSFLGAISLALAIALVAVLLVITFPSEFWHVKFTDVLLVAATIALVGSTIALWLSAERSTRITERAYVKMSHVSPGAMFDTAKLSVQVQIKNGGRTPAQVTDLLLKFTTSPLPIRPDYTKEEGAPASQEWYLRAGDKVFVTVSFDVTPQDVQAVRGGRLPLFVFGYVDYEDVFGVRHRRATLAFTNEPVTSGGTILCLSPAEPTTTTKSSPGGSEL